MARRTKKMDFVQETKCGGIDLLLVLPRLITDQGLSATADQLEISKATLGYWLLKLGIDVRRIALAPGEELVVTRLESVDINQFTQSNRRIKEVTRDELRDRTG